MDAVGQARLVGELRDMFPNFRIVAEEGDFDEGPNPESRVDGVIYVDPLDGTAAYCQGYNTYGISVGAVSAAGEPLFGIIAQPGLRRTFHAEHTPGRPSGVFRNGVPVARSRVPSPLPESYVYVGSDFHRQPMTRRALESFPGKLRALGVCTLQLAMLLDPAVQGDPTAVLVTRACSWDVAGGLVLLLAAGMEVRHLGSGQKGDLSTVLRNRDILPFCVGFAEDIDGILGAGAPASPSTS